MGPCHALQEDSCEDDGDKGKDLRVGAEWCRGLCVEEPNAPKAVQEISADLAPLLRKRKKTNKDRAFIALRQSTVEDLRVATTRFQASETKRDVLRMWYSARARAVDALQYNWLWEHYADCDVLAVRVLEV